MAFEQTEATSSSRCRDFDNVGRCLSDVVCIIGQYAQIKLGFGTDLVGPLYKQQCREFSLRSEVFSPLEILRQATSIGAEVLQLEGKSGCVAADAHAGLIVVDGDPLQDIGLLAQSGRNLSLIMRTGELVKNELAA